MKACFLPGRKCNIVNLKGSFDLQTSLLFKSYCLKSEIFNLSLTMVSMKCVALKPCINVRMLQYQGI